MQPVRNAIWPAAGALFLTGLYLLLASQISGWEIIAAIAACMVASVGATAVNIAGGRPFEFRVGWFGQLAQLPARVIRDCAVVTGAIFERLIHRRKTGNFCVIEFDPGGQTRLGAAKRALLITRSSLAPNTYVVGMDSKKNMVLLHELISARPPLSP
jgi:hypothetical protein